MVAAVCTPFAQGRRMRVTRLDNCGNPNTTDPCGQVVSSGFVQVSVSSEVVAGVQIEPLNANGDLCFQIRSADQFARHALQIDFCDVDPTLMGIVTHTNPVFGYDGTVVGFETLQGGATEFYALEVWMGVPGTECPPEEENPVDSLGYVLFPYVVPGALGDFTIANDAITFSVSGFTRGGGNWGTGPYDVVAQDAANVAGPLIDPITADVHAHIQWTSIPAPAAFCGCEEIIPS